MRSMTRWTLAGCLTLAALGAVAVLDVGSATARAEPSVSPFAGSWSGTWSASSGHNGTFDWTISNAGQLSGRVLHIEDGQGGAVRGHVRADGYIEFIGFAPSDNASFHGAGYPFLGTAVIDGDDELVVSVNGTWSDGPSLVAILVRN